MDTLPALKRLLQEIAQERHGEKTVEARGLLAQIDLEFVVHLVTLRKSCLGRQSYFLTCYSQKLLICQELLT